MMITMDVIVKLFRIELLLLLVFFFKDRVIKEKIRKS